MKATLCISAGETINNSLFRELNKNSVSIKIYDEQEYEYTFWNNSTDVSLDLSDETFIAIAKLAHENDVTINQMISRILRSTINWEEDQKNK